MKIFRRLTMDDLTPNQITVQDDVVVTLDYILTIDGEIVEESGNAGAIEFLQGHGQVIPGLERALYGMAIGDHKQVSISPVDGYGEYDEEAYAEIPLSEFPPEIPLEEGIELQLKDQDGDVFDAYIDEVRENTVLLNFNHPLAGKALDFEVTLSGLRLATEEELDHGHVHSHDHHGH
jgi:FKBP-type peptidyl-prolyl cis-trans isomerase SlyD